MIYYPIDYRHRYARDAELYNQYAEVHKEAVMILLSSYENQKPIHDYSLVPVLNLLRQYIELKLKSIILKSRRGLHQPIIGHDICLLYNMASEEVRKKYGYAGQPIADVERFIITLGEFDKKGEVFRYPETKDGKPFPFDQMDNWLYEQLSDIAKLHRIANEVIGDLDGLGAFLELSQEAEEESWKADHENR
jgi:hypothetical protein